jgi:hypothetical protein
MSSVYTGKFVKVERSFKQKKRVERRATIYSLRTKFKENDGGIAMAIGKALIRCAWKK